MSTRFVHASTHAATSRCGLCGSGCPPRASARTKSFMRGFVPHASGSRNSKCASTMRSLIDASAAPVEAPPSPQDPTVTLGLVMFQDWAGPADTGFRLAWDTAVRAPADGFLEHFPFIARGVEEGTEVRLMLGTDDVRTIAA